MLRRVLLLTGIIHCAVAQVPQQSAEVVFHTGSQLVEVGVVAKDKHGAPIHDLQQSDFVVYDNGRPQQIRSFARHDSAARTPLPEPAPSSEPAAPGPPQRTFSNRDAQQSAPPGVAVIVFDLLNTKWADQVNARREIIRFLRQIQPGDRIGIYRMVGRQFHVLHEFTTDSAELVRRLAEWNPATDKFAAQGKAAAGSELGFEQWLDSTVGRPPGPHFTVTNPAMYSPDELVKQRGAEIARANLYDPELTLRGLAAIANHLAALPGRKSLIWITGGIVPPEPGSEFHAYFSEAARAFNNSHVTLYPVDARGLLTLVADASTNFGTTKGGLLGNLDGRSGNAGGPSHADAATFRAIALNANIQNALTYLGDTTGGRAFLNTNDIRGAIRSAYDDSSCTYTLGYYPADLKHDDGYHKITVKLASRRDAQLRFRKGYFDVSAKASDVERRAKDIEDAVWSPVDSTAIGLSSSVSSAPGAVDLTVHIDLRDIDLAPNGVGREGGIDLAIVQKNARGEEFSPLKQSVQLSVASESEERVLREGFRLSRHITLHPDATLLRIVVRDPASGNVGSLTIPAKGF